MKLPPEVKTISPPNFAWEANAVYRVMVSYRKANPIHEAILHVGFLNDDGTPGAYSSIWRNSYDCTCAFRDVHYLEVIEKLCVLP